MMRNYADPGRGTDSRVLCYPAFPFSGMAIVLHCLVPKRNILTWEETRVTSIKFSAYSTGITTFLLQIIQIK